MPQSNACIRTGHFDGAVEVSGLVDVDREEVVWSISAVLGEFRDFGGFERAGRSSGALIMSASLIPPFFHLPKTRYSPAQKKTLIAPQPSQNGYTAELKPYL